MMKSVRALILAVVMVAACTLAFGATVEVSWNANTESDLAGYKLYYGTASNTYGAPIDVGDVTRHTLTLSPSVGTTYYFAVSAYDTSGNESVRSQEVSLFIGDSVSPGQPKGVIARIIEAISMLLKKVFKIA